MAALRAAILASSIGAALAAAVALGQAETDRGDRRRPEPVAGPVVVDLARLRVRAAAAPTAELERGLAAGDRATRLAMIASAPAAATPGDLLDELAIAAGDWDRAIAASAARSARTIARGLAGQDPRAVAGEPLDDEAREAAVVAWRAVAARRDRWADVRVLALDTAVTLAAAGSAPIEVELASLATDDDPSVRRGAVELVAIPTPAAARPWLVERLVHDPVAAVQRAAGQALCADVPRDAAAVRVALGADGQAAVRALVAAPAPVTAATLDLARCLAIDPDPAAAAALASLPARAPTSWRNALTATIAAARGPRP
jgi:hypothetical protein